MPGLWRQRPPLRRRNVRALWSLRRRWPTRLALAVASGRWAHQAHAAARFFRHREGPSPTRSRAARGHGSARPRPAPRARGVAVRDNQGGHILLVTATHETGHAIALGHSYYTAVMKTPYYSWYANTPQSDDFCGVNTRYISTQWPPTGC
ncbi:MAG: matrixin family metalloprotease [Tepidiformaceae bacterium]